MLRPERVSWKDTNLALIGSDLDHKIKAAAAEHEPQWTNAGTGVGLQVWRIEKFIVRPWPRNQYGKLHTGDSYVILNTYKPSAKATKLAYDIHIWIGSESSQDEYGTAAYKMVELDDHLGGAAVQHREVQGRESPLFLQYFQHRITYLAGGVETGFRHVEAGNGTITTTSSTEPHLFHIKGKGTTLRMTQESPVRRSALNDGDVFVLTANHKVWLWLGNTANHDEKTKGLEVARAMSHGTTTVETVLSTDPESDHAEFWKHVPAGGGGLAPRKIQPANDLDDDASQALAPVLYQCRQNNNKNHTAEVTFHKVATAQRTKVGITTAWKFDSMVWNSLPQKHAKDVLLLDTGFSCFVWMGTESSGSGNVVSPVTLERAYVQQFHRPDELPLTILKQGKETPAFLELFAVTTTTGNGNGGGGTTTTKGATAKVPDRSKKPTAAAPQQSPPKEGTCKCIIL
ncbi:hypothetical protein ACA910_018825 [Epithemia clementina (nom. ined.)]